MTATAVVVEQLRRRVPGGIGTYVRGLLGGLSALQGDGAGQLEVTLVSSTPRGPLEGPERAFPRRDSRLPGPLAVRAWDRGILRAPAGFDVLHATSFASPKPRGEALTVMVHDLSWRRFPAASTPRGRRWHERGLARALADAARVVVPSEPVAEQVRDAGAPAELVTVVAHGCDHLAEPDHAAASELLSSIGVGGPFVLSVGTLEPRKNLARVLRAHGMALDELGEPVPLVVVGPEGWGEAWRSIAPAAGSEGPRAVAVGSVAGPVLSALYERARLLLYVPLDEGFGFPPLEAAIWGTPSVTSTAVPSTERRGSGPAISERVDPGDVDAMAGAIVSLLTDEERARRLAAAASTVASELTWAASARAHVGVWDAVGADRP